MSTKHESLQLCFVEHKANIYFIQRNIKNLFKKLVNRKNIHRNKRMGQNAVAQKIVH